MAFWREMVGRGRRDGRKDKKSGDSQTVRSTGLYGLGSRELVN